MSGDARERLAVVVDYGMGNLRSITKILERAGVRWVISADPADLLRADRLILPGVGAFPDGMRNLRSRGLVEPLNEAVRERGVPILGICLGMELMADESEEGGRTEGLGWIPGRVRRFRPLPGLRIPHVGWNGVRNVNGNPLFADMPDKATFYFVHSYLMECADPSHISAVCEYGEVFTAAVMRKRIFGCQFHPEKSQRNGGTVIHRFLYEEL
jgi:imidazole glycerol-phosphate synthase subunit HisH